MNMYEFRVLNNKSKKKYMYIMHYKEPQATEYTK